MGETLIYIVVNTVNNKYYIGQTSLTLKHRWRLHCSAAFNLKQGKCPHFHAAIRKYSPKAFKTSVLIRASSRDQANYWEKMFIKQLKATDPSVGYNLESGGRAKNVHPETRKKMSEAHLRRSALGLNPMQDPKMQEKFSAMRKGKRPSDAAFAASKVAHIGHKRSVESKQKQSDSLKQLAAEGRHHMQNPEIAKKVAFSLWGRECSEETRQKLRKKAKAWAANNPEKIKAAVELMRNRRNM
jgi:group I intron endonuclease